MQLQVNLYGIKEIESGRLQNNNLETWYNCHIWHAIIDQGLGDINESQLYGMHPIVLFISVLVLLKNKNKSTKIRSDQIRPD